MPPPPDPWGPQVPSLPDGAEPSAHANTLDPNGPEASHFLDNLDMSAFEPCDFDFSSLMDLDQIDDAALLDIPDLDMTDMSVVPIGDSTAADLLVLETSDFQVLTTLDPGSTLAFDQAWLRDAPGSAESGFLAIEAPASFPEPSNVTNVLSPPLASNNPGLPENCHSWGHDGNTSQLPTVSNSSSPVPIQHVAPAPSYFCETTIPTPVLGEHGQGNPSFVSQPVTGPVVRHRGPLPPTRRGGRRGRLTREQAERQLMARANGVCIRCRCVGITCEGGFPCKACLVLRKPRLWRSPCTKAQFLEIIESESFFLRTSIVRNVWIDSLDIETAEATLRTLEGTSHRISVDVLDKGYKLDSSFGFRGLTLLSLSGNSRKPSPDRIREAEKQLLREYPSGTAVDFLRDPERPDRFHWVYTLAFFCSGKRFSSPHEEDATREIQPWPHRKHSPDDILMWFYYRYGELCLFNYLQERANSPRKAIEDQKMFIYSALFILKDSVSQWHVSSLGLTLKDENIQREVEGHLDRQTRVRTALWIFASVFISRLPAYTDFWNHLPQQVEFFKRGPRKNLQKSLTDLDTDLLVSSEVGFHQKRKLLRHLFPSRHGYGVAPQEIYKRDDSRLLWSKMLSNTPQGIREIEQISVGQLASLSDITSVYEQNEAERFMVPKTSEERDETARRFFGGLLSMIKSPIIQNEASFYQPNGYIRPSSIHFMILFSLFIHRIPGRCIHHAGGYSEVPASGLQNMNSQLYEFHQAQSCHYGAADCIKVSERWLKLASLLGDGAYLMGGTKKLNRHPFLDVEYIIQHGSEGEFSRLERLLSRNCSWIRATCLELNGLVQALIQISDTNQLAKIRAFQRMLYRKGRSAFGEAVSSEGGKLSRAQQLSLEHMERTLLGFLPPSSGVEEGRRWVRNTFELAILEAIEDISRGEEEAPAEPDIITWICYPVGIIMPKFIVTYGRTIAVSPPNWDCATTAGLDRMIPRLHEAMGKFLGWYVDRFVMRLGVRQGEREEVLEAFLGIING